MQNLHVEPEELVLLLAKTNHETWCLAKAAAGVTTRTSAISGKELMVAWETLDPADVADNERQAREFLGLLDRLGMKVIRKPTPQFE